MKELYRLATKLYTMRMYTVSLEVSYDVLQSYRKDVDECIKDSNMITLIYSNTDNPNKPPGFTIKIQGVKMYINCPTVKFENDEKEEIPKPSEKHCEKE